MNNKAILDFLNKIKFRTRTLTYAIYENNGKKTVAIILPSSYLDRRLTNQKVRSIEIMECISVVWRNAAVHNYKALKHCHAATLSKTDIERINRTGHTIANEINSLEGDVVRFFAGSHTCCLGVEYLARCIAENLQKGSTLIITSSTERQFKDNDAVLSSNIFTYSEGKNSRNRYTLTYDDNAKEYDLNFLPRHSNVRVKTHKSEIKSGGIFYKTVVEKAMRVLCTSCNYTP